MQKKKKSLNFNEPEWTCKNALPFPYMIKAIFHRLHFLLLFVRLKLFDMNEERVKEGMACRLDVCDDVLQN